MSGNALNYVALLAALVVGYGIFISSSDGNQESAEVQGIMQGYYLRDAVITETTAAGTPHFRVAAGEVVQKLTDNTVALNSLRIDYLKPEDGSDRNRSDEQSLGMGGAAHWVLNSDRGIASENFRKLQLEGNVQAHNLGAPRALVLQAPTLDIDMVDEIATSRSSIDVSIDKARISGTGLRADLARQRFAVESNVGLKLAQAEVQANDSVIQVPDSFVAKVASFDGNALTMTDVASKSPPFVKAQVLKTAGPSAVNNRIELTGNVFVELPKNGSLTADTAIVTLKNRSLSHASASAAAPGKYVEFQHRAKDTNKPVHGRASTIEYDVERGELHLQGNVLFSSESGEWEMDQLDYNIATETWRGTNNRGTINRRPRNQSTSVTDNP